MAIDHHFMQMALQLAAMGRGQTSPNPMVGAVVVKEGRVVGSGAHFYAGGPHAEVHALQMAQVDAEGATLYVTLEPCNHHGRTPPCSLTVIGAGIKRVVVAVEDVDPRVAGAGILRMRAAGLEVVTGVAEAAARKLNEAFFHRVLHQRPFVTWKTATTLDGYIAARTGHSQYVTGPAARLDSMALRQSVDAIAVGAGTALHDNPALTVRDAGGLEAERQPIRVVFDSQLRLPPTAAMLGKPGQTWLLTSGVARERKAAWLAALSRSAAVEVLDVPAANGRVDVPAALRELANRGINHLLLEGGQALADAFWQAGCIDKVRHYLAPKLLGGGIPAFAGRAAQTMADAIGLAHVEVRQVGDDICVEGYPERLALTEVNGDVHRFG